MTASPSGVRGANANPVPGQDWSNSEGRQFWPTAPDGFYGRRLEVLWDMENCPLAPGLTPQQHFDLLAHVFTRHCGVAAEAFCIQAFLPLDSLAALDPRTRESLCRRNMCVNRQHPLGRIDLDSGNELKADEHGLDAHMVQALRKYVDWTAKEGDVVLLISGDRDFLDELRRAAQVRRMTVLLLSQSGSTSRGYSEANFISWRGWWTRSPCGAAHATFLRHHAHLQYGLGAPSQPPTHSFSRPLPAAAVTAAGVAATARPTQPTQSAQNCHLDALMRGTHLKELGNEQYQQKQYNNALRYYWQALQRLLPRAEYESTSTEVNCLVVTVLNNCASAHLALQELGAAAEFCRAALQLQYDNAKAQQRLQLASQGLGAGAYDDNATGQSGVAATPSTFPPSGNVLHIASSMRDMGNAQYNRQQYRPALRYYWQAMQLLAPERHGTSTDKMDLRGALLNNCAAAHLKMGELGAAAVYCRAVLTQHPGSEKAQQRLQQALQGGLGAGPEGNATSMSQSPSTSAAHQGPSAVPPSQPNVTPHAPSIAPATALPQQSREYAPVQLDSQQQGASSGACAEVKRAADSLWNESKPAEALELYKAALALAGPQDHGLRLKLHFNMCQACLRLDKTSDATEHLEAAEKLQLSGQEAEDLVKLMRVQILARQAANVSDAVTQGVHGVLNWFSKR